MIYAKGTTLQHKNGSTAIADGSTNFSDSAWSVAGGSAPAVAPAVPAVSTPTVAPIVAKPTQTSTSAATPSLATIQGQITPLQTQLADLQAQQKALTQYGVDDTSLLAKDATGNYTLKTGGAGTTGSANDPTMQAIQKMLGTSGTNTYQTQVSDLIAKMTQQNADYTTALANQPTAEDTYAKYRDMLGLPQQEAEATAANKSVLGTQQLISDTEDMINKLEGDLNERIQGTTTTEGQRRRILAGEQKPLAEQLSGYSTLLGKQQTAAGMEQTDVSGLQSQLANMLSLSSQDQASALAAAKAPLDFSQSILPTIESLAQYQSPQEKLAQQITQEAAMKAGGYGTYAPAKTTSDLQTLGSATTGYYSYDPTTGKTTKLDTGSGSDGAGTPIPSDSSGVSTAVAKTIQSDINQAIDQYKINPSGFRERFIEAEVARYGENARSYINKQVYALMPDINPSSSPAKTTPNTSGSYTNVGAAINYKDL